MRISILFISSYFNFLKEKRKEKKEENNERYDDLLIYIFIVHCLTGAQYQASTMTPTPFRTTFINYSLTARYPLHRQMTTTKSMINAISSISIYPRSTIRRLSPTDRLQLVTDGSTTILCSPQLWLQRYYELLKRILGHFLFLVFRLISFLSTRSGSIHFMTSVDY